MSNEELDTINHREIIELANIIAERPCDSKDCAPCIRMGRRCNDYLKAERAIKAGYRKQPDAEWEWFEEWSPSTPEHPRECDDCGWRCGKCKTALADVVGGYWDDPLKKPQLSFCPKCGAKMGGGE